MEQDIYDNYVNPQHPTAFSSPGNLKRTYENRYGTKPILHTLQHIDAYTTHREYHKPRLTNPFFIYHKRCQIQMDLIDVSKLKTSNRGTTFILTAIDTFTKYAWARQLPSKAANNTLPAIRNILDAMGEKPEMIFFDRGTEFKNTLVRVFLNHMKIKMVHPSSEKKAAIVERFNKTIQGLIYRFLEHRQTRSYTKELQLLMHAYNTRKHRTIKMTPTEAELPENQSRVLEAHNLRYTKLVAKRKKPKHSVGDRVLVKSLPSNRFHRGYDRSFGDEQFEIVEVKTNMPVPMYILKSLDKGDVIEGGFYAEELQVVKGNVYKVESVLRRRTLRGKKQIFVKWLGWDSSHNQWIDEDEVVDKY